MNKPPTWFTVVAVVALLWNVVGLIAVGADMSLSASDIAALPQEQQALHAARPAWSVAGSGLAVLAGTLGCALLLLKRRWAQMAFVLSLGGIVLQDLGLFGVAGSAQTLGPVVIGMQAMVAAIGLGLLVLSRKAISSGWLR